MSIKKGFYTTFHFTESHTVDPGSCIVGSNQSSPGLIVWYNALDKTTSGSRVLGYRSKIANHRDASSAYSISVTERQAGEGYISFQLIMTCAPNKTRTVWQVGSGSLGGFPAANLDSVTALSAQAKNQAFASFWANAHESASQGMVILGEMRQTIRMLEHPLRSSYDLLLRYLLGVKKIPKRRRNHRSVAREIQDRYLELTFGWQPLINDVKDILKAIKRIQDSPLTIKVQGLGSAESSREVSNAQSKTGYTYYGQRVVNTSKVSCKAVGALQASCTTSGSIEAASSILGFSVADFVPSLYDLLPWSFVLDYFTNTGDVLSSWCHLSAPLVWSNYWTRTESTAQTSFYPDHRTVDQFNGSPYYKCGSSTFVHSPWRVSTFTGTRTVGSIPLPTLTFRLPPDTVNGLRKYLNVAVLLQQQADIRKLNQKR